MSQPDKSDRPVALVTGAAARVGAGIVRKLHAAGYNIVLHFNHSQEQALALAMELNTNRDNSVHTVSADLREEKQVSSLAKRTVEHWNRLDVLVNNASSFYPTPLNEANHEHWRELMASNAEAPFFLVKELAEHLRQHRGAIVNITDIHAESGLKGYAIYSMAKAALTNMTHVMARELAPDVRVNAVAPGVILWPTLDSNAKTPEQQQAIVESIPLKRSGQVNDIAATVLFIINSGTYLTGQVIKVDGGRSLTI